MRNEETNDIIYTAIEMIMFGVLCVVLVYFTISIRDMYSYKEEQGAIQETIKMKSDRYFFEYGEHIYGTDIVEFILKYDANYDYYITLKNGNIYEVTKDYAKELSDEGKDSNLLWTQEYLTNTVFKDFIYKEYTVTIDEEKLNEIKYFIYEK